MHQLVSDLPRRDVHEGPPPGSGGDSRNYSADLVELFKILSRRRWAVFLTTLIAVMVALLFIIVTTPRYTATSTILIDPNRSSVVDRTGDQAAAPKSAADDSAINSQVSLIQSVPVLQRAINQLNLTRDPEFGPHSSLLGKIKGLIVPQRPLPAGRNKGDVARASTLDFLRRRLKVSRQSTTFLIDISASSENPETAAKVANAVADAYFYEQIRSRYDTQKIAALWFRKQIASLKSQVLASDKAVEEFRATHNLTVAQGYTINDQQLSDLNNKLIEAHVQTAEARAKYEQVQTIVRTNSDPGTLSQALSSDVIARLRTQYADVAKNLADVSSKFGSQHPLVVNARAQLRETQRLINEEVHRILESTRQSLQVAQSREGALKKSLDDLKRVSNGLGNDQVRLRELQREADANRTLYASFLARYKEASAQESVELPNSRIVSKSDVPISPSFPRTKLIFAFALFGGAGLGCMIAFAIDHLDRRIKCYRQAEEASGVPTLSVMPLIGPRELAGRARRGRKALDQYDPSAAGMLPPVMQPPLMRYALEEPTSLFAELVRAVRLAIQRASRAGSVKTVMVSSSIDGEGKTTLAVNLALSLAAIGARTILVEGDFRNPEMSRSLCPRASAGPIEVAAGHEAFEKAVLIDRATGLAVLPSPPRKETAGHSDFVFSSSMTKILDELRKHFDYVIIDAPPLIPLVDARALAEMSDRVVLTIRWDSTPQEIVSQAVGTIAFGYERMLGTVLTRVDMKRLRFYDYYRSSSYIAPYSYLGQPRMERAS